MADLLDPKSFRDWNTGDTMQEADYEKEREMIITAVNHLSTVKMTEDGDFKGTIHGKDITEYGDAFNNARLADIETALEETEPVTVTLQRGENIIEAPEKAALVPVEIIGDEVKNIVDPLDSGSWNLAPQVTVNSPTKATLNATDAWQGSTLVLKVKPNILYTCVYKTNSDYAYIEIPGLTGSVGGKSFKFTPTTPTVNFVFGSSVQGTYVFEDIMVVEGDIEREFVQGYQPVRNPYLEVDNGSYLYFDEYLYKGDKLYQTPNGEWRKKQNCIESLLTPENVKTVSIYNSYTGGKGILFKVAEVCPGANTLDQEILKWNGMYFTRTDSKSNQTNNRYYIDGTDLILYLSSADTGFGDAYTPSKKEMLAMIMGWLMHNGNVSVDTPYNGTGVKAWAYRNNGVNGTGGYGGATLALPDILAPNFKPIKIIYKTTSEQDVPAKYEGSLRLAKGVNKVTLGEGIVVREKARPVLLNGFYGINSISRVGSNLSNRVDFIKNIYKRGHIDKTWTIDSSSDSNGNQRTYIEQALYEHVLYTVTYKVLDRYAFSCYVGNVEAKHTTNFHMESNEQVKDIQEIKNKLSQYGIVIIDRLGKKDGVGLLDPKGRPLRADGKVHETHFRQFSWIESGVTSVNPGATYTKRIPLGDILLTKKATFRFGENANFETTPALMQNKQWFNTAKRIMETTYNVDTSLVQVGNFTNLKRFYIDESTNEMVFVITNTSGQVITLNVNFYMEVWGEWK